MPETPTPAATAPYAVGGVLTGSISLASPLPPFLPLTDLRPALQALTFQDGVETLTLASSNVCRFEVATDGAGRITRWTVHLIRFGVATNVPSMETSGLPGVIQGTDLVGHLPTVGVPCAAALSSAIPRLRRRRASGLRSVRRRPASRRLTPTPGTGSRRRHRPIRWGAR